MSTVLVLVSASAFAGWWLGTIIEGGTLIAFTAAHVDVAGNQLFVMSADGSGLKQLTHDADLKTALAWSPDGSFLAYAAVPQVGGVAAREDGGSSISVVRSDGTKRRLLCQACSRNAFTVQPSPECPDCVGPTDVLVPDSLAWSPNGSTLATPAVGGGVLLIDPDSGKVSRIPTPKPPTALAWSPDGSRLAVSHSWFLSANSGAIKIPNPGEEFTALTGSQKGGGGIYLIDRSAGSVEEVVATEGVAHVNGWMPDGDSIVFGRIAGHGKHAELAAYSVSEDRTGVVFAGKSGSAHLGVAISSAGGVAALIGHYNEEGLPIGLATTVPGSTEPRETPACAYERAVDGGTCALPSPTWSPDGNTIAYRGALAGAPLTAVIVLTTDQGETIDVLPLPGLLPDYGSCCLSWHAVA